MAAPGPKRQLSMLPPNAPAGMLLIRPGSRRDGDRVVHGPDTVVHHEVGRVAGLVRQRLDEHEIAGPHAEHGRQARVEEPPEARGGRGAQLVDHGIASQSFIMAGRDFSLTGDATWHRAMTDGLRSKSLTDSGTAILWRSN